MTGLSIGDRVRFTHSHVLQTVTYTAKVVKLDGDLVWVEIPRRVRALPFPPVGGKRFAAYRADKLVTA